MTDSEAVFKNPGPASHGSRLIAKTLRIVGFPQFMPVKSNDFLEYTIESLARNRSVDNMCQELFVNECDWISDFSRNKNKELSKEDVLKILAI